MALVRKITSSVAGLVNKIMDDERKSQIQELRSIAEKWKPVPTNNTFTNEMQTRIAYFHGSMQADMNLELKRRFPQTYKEIWDEQVNLPILRRQTKDKAKVFLKGSQLYLLDDKGNRAPDEVQTRFLDLMQSSRFLANCKQCDEYTQLCSRALFKPWWDVRQEKIRISIWPQHLVHIAPDPLRWWDVDAAHAVLLELPGYDGLQTTTPRYEVWGIRDSEAAIITQANTVHYVSDGTEDIQVNADDVNPFEWNGRAIYPFVWWQCDETTDLYSLGSEDALTINRRMNALLTDMLHAVHFEAWGVWVFTPGEGQVAAEFGKKTIGPNKIIDLPPGSTLENVAPHLPLREVKEIADMIIRDSSMLEGLASSILRTEQAAPESGYSLEVRNKPLKEHRENQIEIYRPYVIDSAKRVCIVWNTYNQDKPIDLVKYKIHWEPGEMTIPVNPDEEGNRFVVEIGQNVSSPADWYMKKTGVDRATALAQVKIRQQENKDLKGSGDAPDEMDNRLKGQPGGKEDEQVEESETKQGPDDNPGDEASA